MDKFDDLFDAFMNNGDNNKKDENKNLFNDIFDKWSDLNGLDKDLIIDELNETLGEPDKLENYEENGVYFQKQIWNTKHGQVIKTILSDVPFNKEKSKKREIKIPLEVQLETAVKNEEYELAAKLRDRISKRDKNKTKK
jgi:excinuclease UvrABC helicase subunit UvrB